MLHEHLDRKILHVPNIATDPTLRSHDRQRYCESVCSVRHN